MIGKTPVLLGLVMMTMAFSGCIEGLLEGLGPDPEEAESDHLLVPLDLEPAWGFGASMGVSDSFDAALVSAPTQPRDHGDTGYVYGFGPGPLGSTQWTLKQKIVPKTNEPVGRFGISLAVNGAHAAVVADGHPHATPALFMFEYVESKGEWVQRQEIRFDAKTQLGEVAMDQDGQVALGMPNGRGQLAVPKVLIYAPDSGGRWLEEAVIETPNRLESTFGQTVSFTARGLFIGDLFGNTQLPYNERGGAFLYTRTAHGEWAQTVDLQPPHPERHWGRAMATSGERVYLTGHDTPRDGEVYVFEGDAHHLEYAGVFRAPEAAPGFGSHIDLFGSLIAVAAPDGYHGNGAVYLYRWEAEGDRELVETYRSPNADATGYFSRMAQFGGHGLMGTTVNGKVLVLASWDALHAMIDGAVPSGPHGGHGGDGGSGGELPEGTDHLVIPGTETESWRTDTNDMHEPFRVTVSGLDVDSDGDQGVDWFRWRLDEGPVPLEWRDVQIEMRYHHGAPVYACTSIASNNDGTCRDPFKAGDEWKVGEDLFFPCSQVGDVSFWALVMHQMLWSDLERTCGEVWASTPNHHTLGRGWETGREWMQIGDVSRFGGDHAEVELAKYDIDGDQGADWLRVRLLTETVGGDQILGSLAPAADDPDHTSLAYAPCKTLRLTAGACTNPITASDSWTAGTDLFLPCTGGSMHEVWFKIDQIVVINGLTRECTGAAVMPLGDLA